MILFLKNFIFSYKNNLPDDNSSLICFNLLNAFIALGLL